MKQSPILKSITRLLGSFVDCQSSPQTGMFQQREKAERKHSGFSAWGARMETWVLFLNPHRKPPQHWGDRNRRAPETGSLSRLPSWIDKLQVTERLCFKTLGGQLLSKNSRSWPLCSVCTVHTRTHQNRKWGCTIWDLKCPRNTKTVIMKICSQPTWQKQSEKEETNI